MSAYYSKTDIRYLMYRAQCRGDVETVRLLQKELDCLHNDLALEKQEASDVKQHSHN